MCVYLTVFIFVLLSALKSEKVKLVACGRDHTIVYTCKMEIVIRAIAQVFKKKNLIQGLYIFRSA